MRQAVIFDLGRVLVDVDLDKTFADMAQLTGLAIEDLWQQWQAVDEAFGLGKLSGQGLYDLLCEQTDMTASFAEFTAVFNNTQQRNETGLQFAAQLTKHPNVKVGIISNTNDIHAGWLRTNLHEFAQFDDVILSNEVGLLKPDEAIYQLSLANLNVVASQAIFVDDVEENITGVEAVGIKGIWHQDWQMTVPIIEDWLQKSSFQ